MSIQHILNTDNSFCATDQFLDTLIPMEYVVDKSPTSPVFPVPGNPYSIHLNPDYIGYRRYLEFIPYQTDYSRKIESHHCKKSYFKNQNKHFRKLGHLKQPGGASCNQRR